MNKVIGYTFLRKLDEISNQPENDKAKLNLYHKAVVSFFDEMTKKENIHLSSLFSKIAFIGNKYKVNRKLLYHLHAFRKIMHESSLDEIPDLSDWTKKIYLCFGLVISSIQEIPYDQKKKKLFYSCYSINREWVTEQKIGTLEILATSCDTEAQLLLGVSKNPPFEEVKIRFNVFDKNELFTKSILELVRLKAFPIPIQLVDLEKETDQVWIPHAFVIHPSFLIDVTEIAECFQYTGLEVRLSLLKKFLPNKTTKYLMLGHVANHILDLLISNPEISFKEFRDQIFELNPIAFSLFSDEVVLEILQKTKIHFSNLKRVIKKEFLENNINKSNVYIEPSFLAPEYGIQGRLDLFHIQRKEKKASIIELKSGKAFRPNYYGLSNNHYVQTLLYDLLIKSSFGRGLRVNSFILYSSDKELPLRYAPALKTQQIEAIYVRNEIMIQHLELEKTTRDEHHHIFDSLKVKNFKRVTGYQLQDLEHFESVYTQLDPLSRAYFSHFAAFIARERGLSKVGTNESEKQKGLASIWLNDLQTKKDNFNILNDLEIVLNNSDQDDPTIIFEKTSSTAKLSNFREGDIVVLYPGSKGPGSAVRNHVMRCIILRLTDQNIEIKLRSRQHNFEWFKINKYWHLEHDVLDSSFNAMYRSLFEFASTLKPKRELWLGVKPPGSGNVQKIALPDSLSGDQKVLLEKIIFLKDYFLLWGPPGTGKTSKMIHHLVSYLYNHTEESLLLMAYTNRAVDELCEAISQVNDDLGNNFIRIGSRFSTQEIYRNHLLDNKTRKLKSRREVIELIQDSRVFVGTVSSVLGKSELFELKKFDRVVIDEASQILEPNLIGLLGRFDKAVLIGDHHQLPAVVQQSEANCLVEHEGLKEIGLKSLSDSLFERLYNRCKQNNWNWAFGQLFHQGRMHLEIMQFPRDHFYQGKLEILAQIDRLTHEWKLKYKGNFEQFLASNRLMFFPSNADDAVLKTNDHEAGIIVKIVETILGIFNNNHRPFTDQTIGIITPYRAQIAKIKSKLSNSVAGIYPLSVDTVERYQGSSRDIIIISFCANHPSQLESLVSRSREGIDRKLNVALTRAKEQIILVGNEEIMKQNKTYKELLDSYRKPEFEYEEI